MESASPGPGTSRHLRVPGRPVRERLAVILELGEGSDMEGHGLHLLGGRQVWWLREGQASLLVWTQREARGEGRTSRHLPCDCE